MTDSDLTLRARGPQGSNPGHWNGHTVPKANRLVTVEEAAQLLAMAPSTIRKWLTQRRLTKVKVGSATRLRLSDVEAVVARGLPRLAS